MSVTGHLLGLAADKAVSEQTLVRRSKRDRLIAEGCEAYPVTVPRTHTIAELRIRHEGVPAGTDTGDLVEVTGRVIFVRDTGGLCFVTLRDGDGVELQAMLALDRLGGPALAAWKSLVDLGDIVGIQGEVVTTRRGELSVSANGWVMAAKALRPLPVAHRPMSEETRVRQRYVDLIVRPDARAVVRTRAAVVRSIRESLHARGYLEVETPMLQLLPGGASARPFVTRSNALDAELYLRIAPELFLKRCVIGGIEKVFEINRNFRNEGVDSSHSPEFAMLEAYQAFADYRVMADLTAQIIRDAILASCGSHTVRHHDGTEIDFGDDWREITLYSALSETLNDEVTVSTPVTALLTHAKRTGVNVTSAAGAHAAGDLAEQLFEALVAPTLIRPTFVYDYPEATSPLTRQHRSTAGLVEKWDLYVNGLELATAYSELVDPVIQRERFIAQAKLGALGDPEAMRVDEDFLRALEFGMPPSGGMGMGIDRLLMAMTGLGIRETILFPLVRPE